MTHTCLGEPRGFASGTSRVAMASSSQVFGIERALPWFSGSPLNADGITTEVETTRIVKIDAIVFTLITAPR